MDEQPLFPPVASSSPEPKSTSQLFPVANRAGSQASAVHEPLTWLSNPSFSEGLLPAPTPIPEWYAEELESQKQQEDHVQHQNADRLLASSWEEEYTEDFEKASVALDKRDESEGGKRKRSKERSPKHKRKKDKKKNKLGGREVDDSRRFDAIGGLRLHRNPGGGSRWVDIETKDYSFDARGDRDNLVYGSLYRMDVPRFYRHQIRIRSKQGKSLCGFMRSEEDDATMDDKTRAEGRYWSAKYASLERRKDFRRLQIILHSSNRKARKSFSVPSGDFISLEDLDFHERKAEPSYTLREESWDGYVMRKTKEFNQLTRERPQDESLWIAFANFQDELTKAASKKAAVQQAVEKKIAVLEKALEIHPFSEDLWLLFLDTCRKKDPASTLVSKWEQSVTHNPKSYKLWRGYLHFRRGEFSLFTVSSLRKVYIHALQTYSAAHNLKDYAEKIEGGNEVETEKNLVSLFVDLCRFEWQTGHHEFAIGLLQAQVEYSIFPPPIEVSERSKKRLFNEFWDSGAPRIGEDGAVGWSEWLQKEEERIRSAVAMGQVDDDMDEKETGGWTGWSEPLPKNAILEDEPMPLADGQVEEDDENAELKDMEEDEKDEAMLLERLGLSLESGQELEVKDTRTWRRWSEEEHSRDSVQWLPIRTSNLKAAHDEELLPVADEEDEQLERAVLFEDIRECLFSLKTADARFDLICQFTDFCDGPYPLWCCSNTAKWKERMEALEHLFGPLLEEMESASLSFEGGFQRGGSFQKLVGGVEWMHESEGRSNFLANALLLLRPLFPHNFWLQEKLLSVEGHRSAVDEAGDSARTHGPRVLAKKLLRNDRQAVLLWGAYARAEALAGNLDVARKVFDTTLASLSSLPEETQVYAPILYQSYAEVELSQTSYDAKRESVLVHQKVLHILSCLGSGIPYTPFRVDNVASSTQILKAKRGFKEQLQNARRRWAQGDLSDQFRSLIGCVAVFELLADGHEAASSVFEESFAISLPGKRQQSLHFELLHSQYIRMLEQHKQSVKPMVLRRTVLRGLAQYPSNPQLLGAYIRCSSRSACTNDLRRFFDDVLQKNMSTVLIWLFAISTELGRAGSGPRIHSLFERALETLNMQQSVLLWRCYMAYELEVRGDTDAARRIYFRAIHACPWSKALWLDGFKKMSTVLSAKELSDFQDIMREKELRLRTDVYEILLEDEEAEDKS